MRALEAAGTAFYYVGDNERATGFYEAQLDVAEEIGDRQGVADALFNLGWTQDWSGRPTEADRHLDRVSLAYRASGDERGLARVAFLRGQFLLRAGLAMRAIEVLQAAYERYGDLDDLAYLSMTTGALGGAYLQVGNRDAAIHWFVDGVLRLAHEIGDEVAITLTLPIGATAAIEAGRPELAAMIMGAHEVLSRAYGIRGPIAVEPLFLEFGPLERAKELLDPLVFEVALERGRQLHVDELMELVTELDRPTDGPPAA
jgi:tetratricopeptide (TPR) repeat protein